MEAKRVCSSSSNANTNRVQTQKAVCCRRRSPASGSGMNGAGSVLIILLCYILLGAGVRLDSHLALHTVERNDSSARFASVPGTWAAREGRPLRRISPALDFRERPLASRSSAKS